MTQTREQFNQEHQQSISNALTSLDDLIGSLKGKNRQTAEVVKQKLIANIPFIERQFAEQIDKTVTEAKADYEAFVSSREQLAGIAAIKEQNNLLMLDEPTVIESEKNNE